MSYELPHEQNVAKTFVEACKTLEVSHYLKSLRKTVIYEMTDGMRTSTELRGSDAYFDGGLFSLRFIHILKTLGMSECYINVIEDVHRLRVNYAEIFEGLKRLYPVFDDYARNNDVKLKFVGNLRTPLEPRGFSGNFAKDLKALEKRTKDNRSFTACFLINYSLDWAMANPSYIAELPEIHVTVRHTKLQYPTGMLLPPSKSDYSSFVYVQQGSSSRTWSDFQLIYLVALALRSRILNEATQYLKTYEEDEVDIVKSKRECDVYIIYKRIGVDRLIRDIFYERISDSSVPFFGYPHGTKRVILTSMFGPEIYEF